MNLPDIPPALLRDRVTNRAPFMDACLICGRPRLLSHICVNPAANPPANPLDWAPPWVAKSSLPDA